MKKEINSLETCFNINCDFDKFQEVLEKREKKLKFKTSIDVNNEFYKLIDDISGRKELHESNR